MIKFISLINSFLVLCINLFLNIFVATAFTLLFTGKIPIMQVGCFDRVLSSEILLSLPDKETLVWNCHFVSMEIG